MYKAGVALSGPHDARYFNLGFVETYDGADNPEAWARASNVDLADRLAGRLLLIHGEMDDQVHPDHTLRLADRLIAADKDFELLIVPGAEHTFIDSLAYVYSGDGGEVSAWIRRTDTPPEITHRSGGTCEYITTGDQTEGRFGLYRWTFGDVESGPDPHFHRSISEQFYVRSGQVRLYDGRGWVMAGPGDFLYVPPGGLHGFRGADGASCC